jgi:hypothetical protein
MTKFNYNAYLKFIVLVLLFIHRPLIPSWIAADDGSSVRALADRIRTKQFASEKERRSIEKLMDKHRLSYSEIADRFDQTAERLRRSPDNPKGIKIFWSKNGGTIKERIESFYIYNPSLVVIISSTIIGVLLIILVIIIHRHAKEKKQLNQLRRGKRADEMIMITGKRKDMQEKSPPGIL